MSDTPHSMAQPLNNFFYIQNFGRQNHTSPATGLLNECIIADSLIEE